MKIVTIRGLVLGAAWLLLCRFKDPTVSIITIVPAATVFAQAVANNVVAIAKKTRKTIQRKRP
jgi:hypothetical protein